MAEAENTLIPPGDTHNTAAAAQGSDLERAKECKKSRAFKVAQRS